MLPGIIFIIQLFFFYTFIQACIYRFELKKSVDKLLAVGWKLIDMHALADKSN